MSFIMKDIYAEAIGAVGGLSIAGSTSAIGLAVINGLNSKYGQERIRREIKVGDETKGYYQPIGQNMTSNIISTMLSLVRYYFANPFDIQPAALLAGIPLGTITEMSHAMSDLVLKFRATGGIFLAHQDGGDRTLRLIGKAWGKNRFLFLTMLELLKAYGNASKVNVFDRRNDITDLIGSPPIAIPEEQLDVEPWKEFNKNAIDEGIEEAHLTFPVITKDMVYNNMYIETYDWTESVEFGMNIIEYTIFLRKYLPEYRIKFQKVDPPKGSKRTEYLCYAHTDESDIVTRRLRMVDLMTDMGFTSSMIMYRYYKIVAKNFTALNPEFPAPSEENTESSEENLATVFSIRLNQDLRGEDGMEDSVKDKYEGLLPGDSLTGFSTNDKEELFVIG